MGILSFFLPRKRASKDTEDNVNKPKVISGFGRRGSTVPMFEDFPTMSNCRAYEIIYEQDTCFTPLQKMARKCGAFKSSIVGGGDRGRKMQEIVDNCIGLKAAQEHMFYAFVEGVRFLYLRAKPSGRFNVLDARGCGGKKINANGNYWWDGFDGGNVVRFAPVSGLLRDEDKTLDRSRVAVFSPTVDVNPEGDTKMALNLLRVAYVSSLLDVAEQVLTERHSLPKVIIKRILDEMAPTDVDSAIQTGIDELEDDHALRHWAMDDKEKLEIIESGGQTWKFLSSLRTSLNGRAHKLVTGENLTSDSTGSGDSGSHEEAEKQLFSVAAYIMSQMSETFTHEVLPFLEQVNEHILPAAKKKDPPMSWKFVPPVEKQRISIQEMLGVIDRGWPLKHGFIASVVGTEVPEGKSPDDMFVMETDEGDDMDEGSMPSSTGQAEQRTDREVPGSGMEPEPRQDTDSDLRNLDKEDDDRNS